MQLKHLIIIAGILVLGACGQKGPLMHKTDVDPSDEAKPVKQSTTQASHFNAGSMPANAELLCLKLNKIESADAIQTHRRQSSCY